MQAEVMLWTYSFLHGYHAVPTL